MYLTVTVDTEEDNWGEFTRSSYSVENLRRLPRLQELFIRYGVTPTYLISYPVATSADGRKILGDCRERGICEIGAHPHPCNTPPFEEDRTEINSYISNLPSDLQFSKIEALTRTIESNFGVRPTTHRSGRWGFSEDVARNLMRLGYTVDTSVFPAWNWSPGPDFRDYTHEPFVYVMESTSERSSLLEVPATVDFLQSHGSYAARIFHAIEEVPLGPTLLGAMSRLQFLNRVCLSPEVADVPDMIRLADTLADRGTKVLNLFLHSPTLLEGCTPFARTRAEVDAFLSRLQRFLAFARSKGFRSVPASALTANEVGASRTCALTEIGVA
jgi:hypothetical protein